MYIAGLDKRTGLPTELALTLEGGLTVRATMDWALATLRGSCAPPCPLPVAAPPSPVQPVAEEVHREECPSSSTLGAAVALLVLLLLAALLALGVALYYGQGWRAEALAAAHKRSEDLELGTAGDASPKTATRNAGDASPKRATKDVGTAGDASPKTKEVATNTSKRATRDVGTATHVPTRAAPPKPATVAADAVTTANIQLVTASVYEEDGEVFTSTREGFSTRELLRHLLETDPAESSSYRWVAVHDDDDRASTATFQSVREDEDELEEEDNNNDDDDELEVGTGGESSTPSELAVIDDLTRRLEALQRD
jgi:hypothetical protein